MKAWCSRYGEEMKGSGAAATVSAFSVACALGPQANAYRLRKPFVARLTASRGTRQQCAVAIGQRPPTEIASADGERRLPPRGCGLYLDAVDPLDPPVAPPPGGHKAHREPVIGGEGNTAHL